MENSLYIHVSHAQSLYYLHYVQMTCFKKDISHTHSHSQPQTVWRVPPLLVFIEDFGHGEADLGNLFVLGVGAHIGTCQSNPVLLRTGLVIRHRLSVLHCGVLFFTWKHN